MPPKQATVPTQGQQMRFDMEELLIIQGLFKNNDAALKVMRKVFLPEYDPKAPFGQVIDLWLTVDLKDKSEFEREVRIQARNEVITHIESQLIQLHHLAGMVQETPEEAAERAAKDSTK